MEDIVRVSEWNVAGASVSEIELRISSRRAGAEDHSRTACVLAPTGRHGAPPPLLHKHQALRPPCPSDPPFACSAAKHVHLNYENRWLPRRSIGPERAPCGKLPAVITAGFLGL